MPELSYLPSPLSTPNVWTGSRHSPHALMARRVTFNSSISYALGGPAMLVLPANPARIGFDLRSSSLSATLYVGDSNVSFSSQNGCVLSPNHALTLMTGAAIYISSGSGSNLRITEYFSI